MATSPTRMNARKGAEKFMRLFAGHAVACGGRGHESVSSTSKSAAAFDTQAAPRGGPAARWARWGPPEQYVGTPPIGPNASRALPEGLASSCWRITSYGESWAFQGSRAERFVRLGCRERPLES